ncbi:MAG: TIGR02594 family protein [Sphingobacteriales bacterium]|nr:MAG: TIGR02594 family protein [Sphingobacteriales bacterium]
MSITIPSQYQWLNLEGGPKMIVEALKLFGTLEVPGEGNNSTITQWANEVGGKVADVYKTDSIPWCGLFMAVIAKRCGKTAPKDPLWALNWGTFGISVSTAMLGDTLVFVRRTPEGNRAGHVAIYVGEDVTAYHVIGGNQDDRVCFKRMAKNRLYAIRRPQYNVQPANVRTINLLPKGGLSNNEG